MPKALKLRELLARLKDFGVIPHPNPARGKGSELVVIKPTDPSKPTQGAQFTLKNHGLGTNLGTGIVLACLRRFGIDKDGFFNGV